MKNLNEKKPTYFELLKLDGKFVSVDNEGKTGLTENISEAYMLDCKVVEVFKKYLNEKIVDGDELIETIKGVQAVQINNESTINGNLTLNEKTCNPVNNGIVLRETEKERVLMKGSEMQIQKLSPVDLKYFLVEFELVGEKILFRILPRPFIYDLYDVANLSKFKWSTRNASGWNNENYEIIIDNEKTENTIMDFYRTHNRDKKTKKITISMAEFTKSNISWILLDYYDYSAVIDALTLLCSKIEEKEDYKLKELTSGFIND